MTNKIIEDISNPLVKCLFFFFLGEREKARVFAEPAFLTTIEGYPINRTNGFRQLSMLNFLFRQFPTELSGLSEDAMFKAFIVRCRWKKFERYCVKEGEWASKFIQSVAIRKKIEQIRYCFEPIRSSDTLDEDWPWEWALSDKEKQKCWHVARSFELDEADLGFAGLPERLQKAWLERTKLVEKDISYGHVGEYLIKKLKNGELSRSKNLKDMQSEKPEIFRQLTYWAIIDSLDDYKFVHMRELAKEIVPGCLNDVAEIENSGVLEIIGRY